MLKYLRFKRNFVTLQLLEKHKYMQAKSKKT